MAEKKEKQKIYKDLIVHPERRKTSELVRHTDDSPGTRYVALDKKILSESTVYQAVRIIKDLKVKPPEYVKSHSHTVDSTYIFLGDNEDLSGLKAEVVLGDETYVIDSPASIFVPKRLNHSVKLIGGSGLFINTVLNGDYNEATYW
ncbi:Uncharacterised protein [uncultured archaeon]|nr:Uncharacterised protein [uncultured archaeon]